MVECILFDLDGVLVDACDWHYLALNSALESIGIDKISRDDHITTYNGLPTKVKLEMLGLHEDECALVWKLKQDYTLGIIKENSEIQSEKIELLSKLKEDNINIQTGGDENEEKSADCGDYFTRSSDCCGSLSDITKSDPGYQ